MDITLYDWLGKFTVWNEPSLIEQVGERMEKFRAEGELPGDITLKIRRTVNRTAGGKKQMLVFGEINHGSHVERRVVPAAVLQGGAMINFAAD